MVGKQFRKKTIIEIVAEVSSGYVVQNLNEPSDRWVIDFETFNETYEEV